MTNGNGACGAPPAPASRSTDSTKCPKHCALELSNLIRQGQDDERLRWKKNGKVTINRDCVPGGCNYTLDSRYKRLHKAIGEHLNEPDWREKSWRA